MAERERLDSLTIFVQVARSLSFSAAARQLGMSPSAVSRAVQRLEVRLGTKLFHRTTRSLSLTDEGTGFYDSGRQILRDLEAAELSLSRSQSIPSGILRLSIMPSMGHLHIMPALPKFTAQYPDLKLDISLSDQRSDLIEAGIDVAIRVGFSPDSSLIMQSLGTARDVVCASPQYLEKWGIPKTPDELQHHLCINHVVRQTGRIRAWRFQQQGKLFSLNLAGQLSIDHAETAIAGAIAGMGIVQFYNFMVGNALSKGYLVPLLQDYAPAGVPIALMYAQKQYLSAKIKVFVAFMEELMEVLKRRCIVE